MPYRATNPIFVRCSDKVEKKLQEICEREGWEFEAVACGDGENGLLVSDPSGGMRLLQTLRVKGLLDCLVLKES